MYDHNSSDQPLVANPQQKNIILLVCSKIVFQCCSHFSVLWKIIFFGPLDLVFRPSSLERAHTYLQTGPCPFILKSVLKKRFTNYQLIKAK